MANGRDLVQRIQQEQSSPQCGLGDFVDGLRDSVDAWMTEKHADAELSRLRSEQRLNAAQSETNLARAEAHVKALETSLQARTRLTKLQMEAEEVEEQLNMQRALRYLPAQTAGQALDEAITLEKKRLELDSLRHKRLSGAFPAAPVPALPPVQPPALPAPAMQPHYDDRRIEEMAVRALTRLGAGQDAQAQAQWKAWEEDMQMAAPTYAAAEVIRRARELRGLV